MGDGCTYPASQKSTLPTGADHTDSDVNQGHKKLDFAGDTERGNVTAGKANAESLRRTKAIVDMYPEGTD